MLKYYFKFGAFLFFMLSCPSMLFAQEKLLEVQGVSRPMYNAKLSFSMTGNIYAITVKPGQAVKEGEPLMHLDSRAEDNRIAQIEAELKNTIKLRTLKARIAQAKIDMTRYQSALKNKAATEMEFQHSKLGYDLSVLALEEEEFRLRQLQLSLKEMQAQRDKMYLYAPRDGFVEDILVERGMAVDRNVVAVHYVSIDPLLVELSLPVQQAQHIKVGDLVEVFQPNNDTKFSGKIVQIAKIAVLSNRTLKVGIHVDNPQNLSAGLMVRVRFPQITAGLGVSTSMKEDVVDATRLEELNESANK